MCVDTFRKENFAFRNMADLRLQNDEEMRTIFSVRAMSESCSQVKSFTEKVMT